MTGVRIYIEGGGNTREQRAALRRGFDAFLKELQDAARAKGWSWNAILCGSRQAAYDDYQVALQKHRDSLNILLVDAEAHVAVQGKPWLHLASQDAWRDPGVGDDLCHLMVQTVEAWLIADPEALAEYYGKNFRPKSLPRNPNVEEIPKQDLLRGLNLATKGKYEKVQHCADLLAKVDVARVRSRAPHCERLFTTLLSLI